MSRACSRGALLALLRTRQAAITPWTTPAILEPGRCELESWHTRAQRGERLLHAGAGCRVGQTSYGLQGRIGLDLRRQLAIRPALGLTAQQRLDDGRRIPAGHLLDEAGEIAMRRVVGAVGNRADGGERNAVVVADLGDRRAFHLHS